MIDDIYLEPVYKIRDSVTGLWSRGGESARFTKRGKVWTSRGHLLAHLVQYLKYDYHGAFYTPTGQSHRRFINHIGATWEVVEISEKGTTITLASEFVKQAPGWKKWLERSNNPVDAKVMKTCPECKGAGKINVDR